MRVRALETSPRLSLPKEVVRILIYSLSRRAHQMIKRDCVGEPKERKRKKLKK